jgi:hypothetical protein
LKSNRKRSKATREPAWEMLASTSFFKAAWSKWVAVWLAWARRRQARSIWAVTESPTCNAPRSTFAEVDEKVAIFLHIGDANYQFVARQVTAIADLSPRFGIERSLVEHHLHRLPCFYLVNGFSLYQQGFDPTG